MPDDPFSQCVYVWTMFATQARRAFRYTLLGVQSTTDLGGGSPGVAAASGPAEAAGVQSPTKGGGMSDDREARRLAVEAAARALIDNRMSSVMTDRTSAAYDALRAAVRRLDAPRWGVEDGRHVLWSGPEYSQRVATCHGWSEGSRHVWTAAATADLLVELLRAREEGR